MNRLAKTAVYLAALGAVVIIGSMIVERLASEVKRV